jgi:ankyrin repeat protein
MMMKRNHTVLFDILDKYKINSLWIASYYGNLNVVEALIPLTKNLYATNQNGSNALHIAVKRSNIDIVRVLIQYKY